MDDLTALALAARGGDRAAVAAFVRAGQADVWRLVNHLVGPAAADDVTQNTFVRVLRSLPDFRGEAPARTWLLTIARRSAADHVRGEIRQRNLLSRLRPAPPTPPAVGDVELDMAIDGLEPDRRTAFVLTQVLGLSYAEAAEVCGCPVGTIRSRVARARDDLIGAISAEASEGATGSTG